MLGACHYCQLGDKLSTIGVHYFKDGEIFYWRVIQKRQHYSSAVAEWIFSFSNNLAPATHWLKHAALFYY
jgi:hypothetical protein